MPNNINLEEIVEAFQASQTVAQDLAQIISDLSSSQDNLGLGTARLTKDFVNLFDTIDGRASQTATILNALADITDLLLSQNTFDRISSISSDKEQSDPMSLSLPSTQSNQRTGARSQSQAETFFARAVKRGLRSL